MVLSANRVLGQRGGHPVARLVLGLAVGATSVVEVPSEVAAVSAEVAGVTVSSFSCRPGLAVSAVTGCSGSRCRFKDRTWLCLRRF